jgi:8-oxo-dGTP pyrophosphatase MutT (NUDIX family)
VTWRGGGQVIPRPAGARPGDPAPWAAVPPEGREKISLDAVRVALERRVPPASVVPDVFLDGSRPGPGSPGSQSAVLVALFEEDSEARVVLTRRAKALRHHEGEVSFPGGRLDYGETPAQCALREADEEIRLDPRTVEVVGQLSTLLTFSSQTLVTPVVGFLAKRPVLDPSPQEVERVFDVALSELVADDVFREERWDAQLPGRALRRLDVADDGTFPVWFFELPGDTVWGATARVLVELLKAVLVG